MSEPAQLVSIQLSLLPAEDQKKFNTEPLKFQGEVRLKFKQGLEDVRDNNDCSAFKKAMTLTNKKKRKQEIKSLLEQHRKDPFSLDKFKRNAFHYMAYFGFRKALKYILHFYAHSKDAAITKEEAIHQLNSMHDPDGLLPIHLSIMSGNVKAVQLLIGFGVNLNAVQQNASQQAANREPLGMSIAFGYSDITELLLNHDVLKGTDLVNCEGQTPFMFASHLNRERQLKLLLNAAKKTFTPVKVLELINQKDKQGFTALQHAIVGGFHNLVKILINEKAFVDWDYGNPNNPLLVALTNKNLKIANLLLGFFRKWNGISKNINKLIKPMIRQRNAVGLRFCVEIMQVLDEEDLMFAVEQDWDLGIKYLFEKARDKGYIPSTKSGLAQETSPLFLSQHRHGARFLHEAHNREPGGNTTAACTLIKMGASPYFTLFSLPPGRGEEEDEHVTSVDLALRWAHEPILKTIVQDYRSLKLDRIFQSVKKEITGIILGPAPPWAGLMILLELLQKEINANIEINSFRDYEFLRLLQDAVQADFEKVASRAAKEILHLIENKTFEAFLEKVRTAKLKQFEVLALIQFSLKNDVKMIGPLLSVLSRPFQQAITTDADENVPQEAPVAEDKEGKELQEARKLQGKNETQLKPQTQHELQKQLRAERAALELSAFSSFFKLRFLGNIQDKSNSFSRHLAGLKRKIGKRKLPQQELLSLIKGYINGFIVNESNLERWPMIPLTYPDPKHKTEISECFDAVKLVNKNHLPLLDPLAQDVDQYLFWKKRRYVLGIRQSKFLDIVRLYRQIIFYKKFPAEIVAKIFSFLFLPDEFNVEASSKFSPSFVLQIDEQALAMQYFKSRKVEIDKLEALKAAKEKNEREEEARREREEHEEKARREEEVKQQAEVDQPDLVLPLPGGVDAIIQDDGDMALALDLALQDEQGDPAALEPVAALPGIDDLNETEIALNFQSLGEGGDQDGIDLGIDLRLEGGNGEVKRSTEVKASAAHEEHSDHGESKTRQDLAGHSVRFWDAAGSAFHLSPSSPGLGLGGTFTPAVVGSSAAAIASAVVARPMPVPTVDSSSAASAITISAESRETRRDLLFTAAMSRIRPPGTIAHTDALPKLGNGL